MVNNSLAVLPGLQNDVTRSIGILLLSELQTFTQFPDIAALNHTKHPAKCQQNANKIIILTSFWSRKRSIPRHKDANGIMLVFESLNSEGF
jgi:hypothetical protein